MKLSSLLNEDLVFLGSPITDKKAAITFLVQKCGEKFGFKSRISEICQLVEAREALGGTTFPSALAVPHARIPSFNDMIIAVAIPKVPFDDQGQQVNMITLLLTSESNPSIYLNTLSSFAKLSMNLQVFPRLLKSRSPKEFCEIVESQGYSVKKEIVVADIMSAPKFTGSLGLSLKEITDLMFQNRLSFLPVVDDEGILLGELRLIDIINLGVPPYARLMGGVKFTSSLEPFEKFLREESRFTVSQVMQAPEAVLAPGTSLLEAAVLFSNMRERQLSVLDGKKLVGILSTMDILSKVLRV